MRLVERSALTAGLCLYACARIFVQDSGGAAAQEASAQIEVVVSVGSEPAADATVIAAEDGLKHVASATTDPRGRALLSVPPGRYRVSATRDGHHMQVTPAQAAGGSTVSVRLALTPVDPFAFVPPGSGVVSGRVVGRNGDPVPYASVSLYEKYTSGGGGQTAADGTFRIPVRASQNAYDQVEVSQSTHIWSEVPPMVYLADRTDLKRPVRVQAKQETAGLELQVSTSPHYRVTVTVRDELGGAVYNPAIMLYGPNRSAGSNIGPDGKAVFGPLPRGPVTLFGTADGRNGIRLAGVKELDIVDRPLDDVVILLAEAARVRGRVEFADRDESARPRPSPTRVEGQPMLVLTRIPGRVMGGYSPDDLNGRVAPDGSFTLAGLLGVRCLWLSYIPAGYRLGAILRDGRDITHEPITFSAGQQVDGVIFRLEAGQEVDPDRSLSCNSR